MILRFLFMSFLLSSQIAYAVEGTGNPVLDFVYKVVNFVVLVGIIIFFAKKPVSSMISQKAVAEKQELYQIKLQLQNLEQQLHLKRQELAEYKNRSASIIDEARHHAANEKREILAESQLRVEKMKEQTKQIIQYGYSKAQTELLEWAASYLVEDVGDKLKKTPQLGDVEVHYKNVLD